MILTLYIAAGALEAAGLGFVAFGFHQNWREHAPDQDFWVRPKRWTARSRRRLVNAARWVIRKPPIPGQQVVGVGRATTVDVTLKAHGVVGLTWPPDPEKDLIEFANVIHERINTLHTDVASLKHKLTDERDARIAAEAKLRDHIDSQRQDARAETHEVAVSGLWWEFVGWSLLLVGIVLGTVTNIAAYVAG